MSGKASHEQLLDLWRELLGSLVGVFKGPKRPSVEHLQVARRFLTDNGQFYAPDEASRKNVEKLQRLYLERLVEAMDAGHASPALLGETRQFLTWAGHHPNTSPGRAKSVALDILEMELPFGNSH
jgi:hypothetical protein